MLKLLKYPHPLLRQKLSPLNSFPTELPDLVGAMEQLLCDSDGVGLAANQVGLQYRLFLVRHNRRTVVYINPQLKRLEPQPKVVSLDEGCLSIPGIYLPVRRPNRIKLSYQDLQGSEKEAILEGLPARIAQHELDHLNGKLFLDRVVPSVRIRTIQTVLHLRPELKPWLKQEVGNA